MNRRGFLKRTALVIASISGAAEFVSSTDADPWQIEAPVQHAVLVGGPEDGALVICHDPWIHIPVCAWGRNSFGTANYKRDPTLNADGSAVYRYDKTIW